LVEGLVPVGDPGDQRHGVVGEADFEGKQIGGIPGVVGVGIQPAPQKYGFTGLEPGDLQEDHPRESVGCSGRGDV